MKFTFRIATYNIHKCRGLDRRVRPARIAKVLQEVDADVVALQEVVSVPGEHELDQARFIATELGFHYCLGENRTLYGGAYGNVLLSRFPLRAIRNHDITAGRRERRGCLRADIHVGRATLHVFNVHLGTSFLERRRQARKLVSPDILLDPALRGARVVLGDFNEWTHGLATSLLCNHFQSVDIRRHLHCSRTYPGVAPFLHLDHIYYDTPLKVERLILHKSLTALIASDHLPLVADLHFDFTEVTSSSEHNSQRDYAALPRG